MLLLLLGCREENLNKPSDEDSGAPGQLEQVQVKNIPGGAELTYTLPNSANLLYVRASYEIRPGLTRETKASYHRNTLVVDGFPDTNRYTIRLSTVSRSEVESDPIYVDIKPLIPPVLETFKSLDLQATFGGLSIAFENSSGEDLAINVLATDSIGDLVPADIIYTRLPKGIVAVRGFDDTERKFGVYIRDRWENYSDTVFATLTPLYEMQLDKTKFKSFPLPTDDWQANQNTPSRHMGKLWDGNLTPNDNHYYGPFTSFPSSFSFDLGAQYALSRMIFYPNGFTSTPRFFELYGSNNPSPDGSWESWTKLMDGELVKPSGLPPGQHTEDDLAYANAGIDYEFPIGTEKYRYLRFRTLSVWVGQFSAIKEITLYGNDR